MIKISQLDNKTSLDLNISVIRSWGASYTIFFLELGELQLFCLLTILSFGLIQNIQPQLGDDTKVFIKAGFTYSSN